jgi:hypothetical protein
MVFRSPPRGHFSGWAFRPFFICRYGFARTTGKNDNGLGYELVDVEQSPHGRVLRVFIDKPDKPAVSTSTTVRWSAISCRAC